MTGVGGRPEVVVEGSNSLDKGWKEYGFYYKPGNVSQPPPIVGECSVICNWLLLLRFHNLAIFTDPTSSVVVCCSSSSSVC